MNRIKENIWIVAVLTLMAWGTWLWYALRPVEGVGAEVTVVRSSWYEVGGLYFAYCDSDSAFVGLSEQRDTTITRTTARGRWMNRLWWWPSCYGRVAVRIDSIVQPSYDASAMVAKNITLTERRIEELKTMTEEVDYFLETHDVEDAGYELVTERYEYILAETKRQQRLLSRLRSYQTASHPTVEHKSMTTYTHVAPDTTITDTCYFDGRYFVTKDHRTPRGAKRQSERREGVRPKAKTVIPRYPSRDTIRNGFGLRVTPERGVQLGEWKDGKFKGERLSYNNNRIYGIDISRFQHEKGRKRFAIDWSRMRITSLGRAHNKNIDGTVDFPVSFCYIKATEGITIRNRYYASDYAQARKHGIQTGTYHFFSTKTTGARQAKWFLRNLRYNHGDLPPVLDIEPSAANIRKMGGTQALFREVRTWLRMVEQKTGQRPILYISQTFVNKYLCDAPDLKRDYQVWIARYGEYKPDVHMLFWQLTPEGRVSGIRTEVDINVMNKPASRK